MTLTNPIYIFFLLAAICTNLFAKEIKNTKISAETISPFDKSQARLPPNYKGTDIISIFNHIKNKVPLEKSEFETTNEFLEKAKNLTSPEVYAIKIEKIGWGLGGGMEIKPYDADLQKYQILIKPNFHIYARPGIITKEIENSRKNYAATNGFGTQIQITNYLITQYGIVINNPKYFGENPKNPWNDRYISLEIPAQVEIARLLKNNIGVLIICKPEFFQEDPRSLRGKKTNGLIIEDMYAKKATHESPAEIFIDKYLISAEAQEIWAYNIQTGEILQKKLIMED